MCASVCCCLSVVVFVVACMPWLCCSVCMCAHRVVVCLGCYLMRLLDCVPVVLVHRLCYVIVYVPVLCYLNRYDCWVFAISSLLLSAFTCLFTVFR